MIKKVPYSYAKKYVELVLENDNLPPIARDTLRRQTHDAIARMLGVETGMIKRAAYVIEYLGFGNPLSTLRYSTEDIIKIFKVNLDEIYKAKISGDYSESTLIATFTFNTLHPDTVLEEK